MSFSALAWAVKQDTKSPISKLVLLMIANYANEYNEAYPSQQHLAKLCQCTRVSINKHIKDLNKLGLITTKKQKNNMYGYNLYVLNIKSVNNIDTPNVNNIDLTSKQILHNTQDTHNSLFTS